MKEMTDSLKKKNEKEKETPLNLPMVDSVKLLIKNECLYSECILQINKVKGKYHITMEKGK